jgi:tyrosine decarboxylase/aspartate 1-decarboxylase
VPIKFFGAQHNLQASSADTVLCLRSVLMKPEHRDWLGRIWAVLSRVANSVLPLSSPNR